MTTVKEKLLDRARSSGASIDKRHEASDEVAGS